MADTFPSLQIRSAQAPENAMSNPLELMGGMLKLQGGMIANKLAGSELAARQRAGEIMKAAPSLTDGINALKNDPLVAPFATDIITNLTSVGQGLASTQSTNIANQNTQATLAAKVKAGQIISKAPDLASGIDQMKQDPSVAAFAPEIITNQQALSSALTTQQGAVQTQAESGLGMALKLMGAGISDPTQLIPSANAAIATMSPGAQKAVAPALTNLVKSLTDGLPDASTPEGAQQARDILQKRIAAIATSSGLDVGTVRAMTGTVAPSISMQPNAAEGGAAVPTQMGGPMTGASSAQVIGGDAPIPPPVKSLTPQELAASNAQGAATGDLATQMNEKAEIFPTLKRVDLLADTLSHFQSGGGADYRTAAATTMQALKNMGLDISQEKIDAVANSSLAANELFNSEIKPLALAELKQTISGAGKIMLPEVGAAFDSMDSTKDPAVLMTRLNQLKTNLARDYDQSQKYIEFKRGLANKDPALAGYSEINFPSWYASQYNEKNLPTQTGGGMNLAPTPLTNAKGGAAIGGTGSNESDKSGKKKSLDDIFAGAVPGGSE